MRKIRAVSVLTTVVLASAGCSMPQPSTAPLKETPAAAESKPAAKDSGPTTLTGTAPVGKTLSAKISGIKRAMSGQWDVPGNTPYVKLTVAVENKGSKAVDPSMIMVSCAYGSQGTASDDVYYENQPAPPTVKILPGKTSTFEYACTLPKDETTLQVQVADVMTGESAVFQGEVK